MVNEGTSLPEDEEDHARRLIAAYSVIKPKVTRRLQQQFGLDVAAAEDLAQEAILRVYRSGRLDPNRDPLPFVWTKAKWLAQRMLKRSGREVPAVLEDLEIWSTARGAQTNDEDKDDDAELWNVVDPAIQAISARQSRQVLECQRLGLEDDEISDRLQITRTQLHVQRHRGVKKVQEAEDVQQLIREMHLRNSRRTGQ